MALLELYRRTWLWVALSVWLGALAIYVVALPFVGLSAAYGGWGGLLAIEGAHHLSLLSPFLAWEVARDRVREARIDAPGGGWVPSGALPRWPLWLLLGYAALTLLTFGLDGAIGDRGSIAKLLLVARIPSTSTGYIAASGAHRTSPSSRRRRPRMARARSRSRTLPAPGRLPSSRSTPPPA